MQGTEDIIYGSVAGALGKCFEHPFDTVKVRLQSQTNQSPLQYKGAFDCFRQAIQLDGLKGLYRGITPPLAGSALETSSLFFSERIARNFLHSSMLYPTGSPLPLETFFYTGAAAGAFTSFILTPFELVKCKLQIPKRSSAGKGLVSESPSLVAVIQQIFRHRGVLGFWHGHLGTFIRETGGGAAWFGCKETVSLQFQQLNASSGLLTTDGLPLWQQAIAGATAGVSYSFLFFPADTIKSRMQTSQIDLQSSNRRFAGEVISLWKEEGLRGFCRGSGITIVRSAPSSAMNFIVYDTLKHTF